MPIEQAETYGILPDTPVWRAQILVAEAIKEIELKLVAAVNSLPEGATLRISYQHPGWKEWKRQEARLRRAISFHIMLSRCCGMLSNYEEE